MSVVPTPGAMHNPEIPPTNMLTPVAGDSRATWANNFYIKYRERPQSYKKDSVNFQHDRRRRECRIRLL